MTGSRWMAAGLGVVIVVAAVPGGQVWAAGPGVGVEQERSVRLAVDVEGLRGYEGFDSAAYEEMARLALTDALQERGYAVTTAGDTTAGDTTVSRDAVSLALSWRDFDASSYDLVFTVQGEGRARSVMPRQLCERCNDDQLVAAIESHVDEVLVELRGEPASAGVDAPVGPQAPGPQDDAPSRQRSLAPLAAVGIGVAGLGLGGVVTGAILASTRDRLEPAPEGDAVLAGTDYATPGIAVLVSGSVLLAAGVALAVVGQVRHARRGGGRGQSRVTWSPTAAVHGAGLLTIRTIGIMGRF